LTRGISPDTGLVIAEGRVIHRGRRLATAEGTLRDAKGNLLAHGTTTCMLMERAGQPSR
jgi:acyl-coenzyme A thioesterase PaaI-like protein